MCNFIYAVQVDAAGITAGGIHNHPTIVSHTCSLCCYRTTCCRQYPHITDSPGKAVAGSEYDCPIWNIHITRISNIRKVICRIRFEFNQNIAAILSKVYVVTGGHN